MSIEIQVEIPGVVIGWVHAIDCVMGPAPDALSREIDRAVANDDESVRTRVRDLLRFGKYKPTGRGKPASEYLRAAHAEGRFPRIDALVDINNLVSLESGLPISVLDVERAASRTFIARRGAEAERYVFNSAGQEIELHDLLLIATPERACANAVKDSMATKVIASTREVLAILYAPESLKEGARSAAQRMAALIEAHCSARATHGVQSAA